MAKISKSRGMKSSKAYMWKVNPDKDSRKFSHKRYDGATRKSTRKI